MADPHELRSSLQRVVGGLSGGGGGGIVEVLGCWDEVVGDSVATHARPRRLRGTTLLVEVDQPAWATQLRYLRGDIAARINERLGRHLVESIELTVARS